MITFPQLLGWPLQNGGLHSCLITSPSTSTSLSHLNRRGRTVFALVRTSTWDSETWEGRHLGDRPRQTGTTSLAGDGGRQTQTAEQKRQKYNGFSILVMWTAELTAKLRLADRMRWGEESWSWRVWWWKVLKTKANRDRRQTTTLQLLIFTSFTDKSNNIKLMSKVQHRA